MNNSLPCTLIELVHCFKIHTILHWWIHLSYLLFISSFIVYYLLWCLHILTEWYCIWSWTANKLVNLSSNTTRFIWLTHLFKQGITENTCIIRLLWMHLFSSAPIFTFFHFRHFTVILNSLFYIQFLLNLYFFTVFLFSRFCAIREISENKFPVK